MSRGSWTPAVQVGQALERSVDFAPHRSDEPATSGAAIQRVTATMICAVWPDHSPLSSQLKAVE